MRYLIVFIFLLCSLNRTSARNNGDLLKANYLYTRQAFSEAIPYYHKLTATNNSSPEVLTKLGDCYRMVKDPQNAAAWYEKAISAGANANDVRLHYAQALMNLQQYDKALPYLRQCQQDNPQDRRVANLIKSCEQSKQMKEAIPSGTVSLEPFNTDYFEFGPAIRNNELFYTADTFINGLEKSKKGEFHPFYTIYGIDCGSFNQCNGNVRTLGGKINSRYHDGPCTFTGNGNMYFTRTNFVKKFLTKSPIPDKNNVVHLQIVYALDYDEQDREYKGFIPFRYNSNDYSTAHPSVSKDGKILVFASDMPGGKGGNDLYMCRLDGAGEWMQPVNLGSKINTEGDEMFPYISADNKLYFASDGHIGLGGLDIYQVALDGDTVWATPSNIGMPLNSSYDDMSLVLLDDGTAGYFASNRPAAKKGDNIFRFNRQNLFLSLKVVDDRSGKPVPGASVDISSGSDRQAATTDERGNAFMPLGLGGDYKLLTAKAGYDTVTDQINYRSGNRPMDTIFKTIRLTRGANIHYNVIVIDEKTRLPVEDPTLVFVRFSPLRRDSVSLRTGQVYTTPLEENRTYNVYAIKDNYYGNEKFVSTKNINPGAGGVRINDTIFMKKLQIGEVYKIDNIYYDYNKANIREDAKPSLDRLLDVLNQYPKMQIQINSHTDCRGSDAYNLRLSNSRAHSVIKYLQQRGIPISRLKYKGFGESDPVDKCNVCDKCSEAQHQNNRRTEFQILTL